MATDHRAGCVYGRRVRRPPLSMATVGAWRVDTHRVSSRAGTADGPGEDSPFPARSWRHLAGGVAYRARTWVSVRHEGAAMALTDTSHALPQGSELQGGVTMPLPSRVAVGRHVAERPAETGMAARTDVPVRGMPPGLGTEHVRAWGSQPSRPPPRAAGWLRALPLPDASERPHGGGWRARHEALPIVPGSPRAARDPRVPHPCRHPVCHLRSPTVDPLSPQRL